MPISITTSNKLIDSLSGSLAFNSQTIAEKWLLRVSGVSGTTTPQEIISAAGYAIGDAHPQRSGLSLSSASIEPAAPDLWTLSLDYQPSKSVAVNLDPGDPAYKPRIAYGRWSIEQVAEYDFETGVAIRNSAGDPYAEPPTFEVSYPEIRVTVREATAPTAKTELIGSVNDASFTFVGFTAPAFCAMLADIAIDPEYDETGAVYFLVTYTIRLNYRKSQSGTPIGFKAEVLQSGYNRLVGGVKQPIYVGGQQTPVPQLLDGAGAVTTTPNYKTYLGVPKSDFSTLGLPAAYPSY